MRHLLSIVLCFACVPVLADRTFVAGDLELIEDRLSDHDERITFLEDAVDGLTNENSLGRAFALAEQPKKIPTPPMPDRLVGTPVRNVAAAVVTAPMRMVRRRVCQNGQCSYVMVPATVTAAPVVVTAAPVPIAVRSVQRAGCVGGSCYRSRTVFRRGLFGRWR